MNSKKKLKIGLVQTELSKNFEQALEKAKEKLKEAEEQRVEFLAFPEMFMTYPSFFSSLKEIAQSIEGEFVQGIRELAKQKNIFIATTFWEKTGLNDKVYNTAVLCSPSGEIITTYRKLHLFDAFELNESSWIEPGEDLPEVVDIEGIKVAITICYDLRFPELYRYLAKKGVHLVFVLSAWYKGILKEDHWITLLRSRSIENTIYIAGTACIGKRFCGRSCVIDPFGVIIADAGEEEKVLTAEVCVERLENVRKKLPVLRHIREDLF